MYHWFAATYVHLSKPMGYLYIQAQYRYSCPTPFPAIKEIGTAIEGEKQTIGCKTYLSVF
jgi:hypothetical protein